MENGTAPGQTIPFTDQPPLEVVNVARYRQAIDRPGVVIVDLSPPDKPHEKRLVVRVALDDTETLIMQDRLPNPLRKSAIEAAEAYEEQEKHAEEIDPKTGNKRGWDVEALKYSLEYIDHAIASVVIEPPYILMKDAGKGAVPPDALCLKDFGDYEQRACLRLVFGGLAGLERFRKERSSAANNKDGARNRKATEQSSDTARAASVGTSLAERSAIHTDTPTRQETARARPRRERKQARQQEAQRIVKGNPAIFPSSSSA